MTPSIELPKRRALGKGLESLLPGRSGFTPAPTAANAAPVPDEGKPREIPVDLIERNPFQTRATVDESALKELSAVGCVFATDFSREFQGLQANEQKT